MWKNRLAFALLYAALLALLTAGQLGLHMTSGSRAIPAEQSHGALGYRRCCVPVRWDCPARKCRRSIVCGSRRS